MMYLIHRRVAMIKPSHANPCYFGKTRCYQLQTRNGKACYAFIILLTATVSLRLSRLLFRLDVHHNMRIYFFQFSFRCKVYRSTKYLRVLIFPIFAGGGNVFAILQNPSNIYALCSDETSASQTRYKAVNLSFCYQTASG